MKHECSRCCYDYEENEMEYLDDAWYCIDCEDTHSGWVCNECNHEKNWLLNKKETT